MRVVICGDTHIGAVFGLGCPNKIGGNTRVDDYEKTLNYIVDYAIENKVDVFIQTGDVFENRNPDPTHMHIFSKALKRLSLANITSAIIMGNHDYIRSNNNFTSAISSLAAKDYSNVRIVLEPEVLKFYDKKKGGANIILLPYRDRRMYGGKNIKEDSALYEMEVKSLLKTCDEKIPTIAVGHNFFYQGSYNDFGGTEVLVRIDSFDGCDMITMGHYHKFKILRKTSPIAIYSGSMERLNFGDENIDKYFIDYNTKTKETKIIKSPSRRLNDISIDLSKCSNDDFQETLNKRIGAIDLDDSIVRLKIIIKDKLMYFVSKNSIEKKLYDAGAFFVSRITVEPIFTRVIRDDAILKHKNDLSMFSAFLDDQSIDDSDKELILTEVKKIIV